MLVGNWLLPYPAIFITLIAGVAMSVYGCYLWTKLKNRHPAFALWGILSPIGLLGISLLSDKSEVVRA
jgi:hypothetical protein